MNHAQILSSRLKDSRPQGHLSRHRRQQSREDASRALPRMTRRTSTGMGAMSRRRVCCLRCGRTRQRAGAPSKGPAMSSRSRALVLAWRVSLNTNRNDEVGRPTAILIPMLIAPCTRMRCCKAQRRFCQSPMSRTLRLPRGLVPVLVTTKVVCSDFRAGGRVESSTERRGRDSTAESIV